MQPCRPGRLFPARLLGLTASGSNANEMQARLRSHHLGSEDAGEVARPRPVLNDDDVTPPPLTPRQRGCTAPTSATLADTRQACRHTIDARTVLPHGYRDCGHAQAPRLAGSPAPAPSETYLPIRDVGERDFIQTRRLDDYARALG